MVTAPGKDPRGPWLLCDYGEVLCQAPPAATVYALVARSGLDAEAFGRVYWEHRLAYDRGDLSTAEYWSRVLGAPPGPEDLTALVDLDIGGWLHPAPAALAATDRAATRGMRLAVLSNAPHDVADAIDKLAWLAPFSPRMFSARLGRVKPDPSIYDLALYALGAAAGDVWFVDDREANVAAAAEFGIHAVHYRGDPAIIDTLG